VEPGLPFVVFWSVLAVGGAVLWLRVQRGSRWVAIAQVCLCLALGGLAGEGVAFWRDQQMRVELLLRSHHLAAGLDRTDLAAHTNQPADLGQPWFERIKARLTEARRRDPELVYAYLLEMVGGQLLFPNDDDPVDMKDYEPPGTVYTDAPQAMRQAVILGNAFALGPYQDRWGDFISVGTTIDLGGGRAMSLVLDVSAKRWSAELWFWRSWPLAFGLALAGIAILFWSRGRALVGMREAARAAEEANRAKDAYLATISHDLRKPLGGIIGMTGLLADTELSVQQREFVQLAHNSGQQLLSLVNGLLDYARIEAGELEFDRIPCRIREVVEDTVALLAPLATSKGIELNAVVERGVPESLIGDPDRIRQVLHNLISNAVKFTDEGEVAVLVSIMPVPGTERVRIICAVRDTGIGIDLATQARLFQPFSQASEAGRRRGGTGLGLCIAQRIARGLDGDLVLQSAPRAGSTFTATVVLDPDPQPPEVEAVPPSRRGAQVVIGVWHPTLRESLCQQVASLGLQPLPAADVGEVARLAGSVPAPVAVLVDADWASEALPGLSAAGLPVGVLAARSAGGTQVLARRRLPVLLRPVRRSALLHLLTGLWGPRSVSTRCFQAVGRAMERTPLQISPLTVKPPAAEAESDDYTPSMERSVPIPSAPPVASPAPPVAVLAGGLFGGLRSGIDSLRAAAGTGDLITVRRAAQGLRSAAEPLRLTELVDTCIALENAVSSGDHATVQHIALTLDDMRRRIQLRVDQLRRDGPQR
jgi:signal transduction histidine kinase